VRGSRRRQAGHGRAGKAACTVRAHAPPGQDAPRRLSLSSAGGRKPSGHGRHHVRLPRLLPYLGQVEEGGERGEASNGQKPVRTGAGGGKRVVPTQSASILARSACPSVPDVARPLCLLRHIGQLSTHTMVRLPGRGAVEEMAGPSPLPSSTASSPHEGLQAFCAQYAKSEECDFCGATDTELIAAPLDDVIDALCTCRHEP